MKYTYGYILNIGWVVGIADKDGCLIKDGTPDFLVCENANEAKYLADECNNKHQKGQTGFDGDRR